MITAAPLDFSTTLGEAALAAPSATEPIPLTLLVGRLSWFVVASGAVLGVLYVFRDQTLALSTRAAVCIAVDMSAILMAGMWKNGDRKCAK